MELVESRYSLTFVCRVIFYKCHSSLTGVGRIIDSSNFRFSKCKI